MNDALHQQMGNMVAEQVAEMRPNETEMAAQIAELKASIEASGSDLPFPSKLVSDLEHPPDDALTVTPVPDETDPTVVIASDTIPFKQSWSLDDDVITWELPLSTAKHLFAELGEALQHLRGDLLGG